MPGHQPKDPKTGLTVMETAFIREYVLSGGKKQESAILAGYNEASAHTRAWEMLQKPRIILAIAGFRREMYQHDATVARTVLNQLMTDKHVSPTVKKDIALALMDRAGDKHAEKLELSSTSKPKDIETELAILLGQDAKEGETKPHLDS